MIRANRLILWGASLAFVLVALSPIAPFFLVRPEHGRFAGGITIGVAFMAAYFFAAVGFMSVAAGTAANWALRRSDPSVESRRNRRYFYFGLAFSVLVGSYLVLSFVG